MLHTASPVIKHKAGLLISRRSLEMFPGLAICAVIVRSVSAVRADSVWRDVESVGGGFFR